MRNIRQFVIFLVFALTTYFLVNWYVVSRWAAVLEVGTFMSIIWVSIAGTVSYIVASMLETRCNNWFSKIIYISAAAWMGLLSISVPFVAFNQLMTFLLKVPESANQNTLILVFFLIVCYALFNARRQRIIPLQIHSKKITTKTRIVQLSDLHLGPINTQPFLKEIIAKVQSQKPDVVVITGDLVDGPGKLDPELLTPLNDLKVPILYTIGNHERYEGIDKVKALVSKTKINLLENKDETVRDIHFIGIDDSDTEDQVKKNLGNFTLNKNQFNILLYHRPKGFEYAVDNGIDLMLSGHTHAGQIIPFNLLVRLSFKYLGGYYSYKEKHLYVNPGTGTWGPPMRLGSKCEIVSIDLLPSVK